MSTPFDSGSPRFNEREVGVSNNYCLKVVKGTQTKCQVTKKMI